jgi:imidazole glycerol-phosphate synthase subunit HisH
MTADVVIIDSGGANLASLQYALQRLGAKADVSVDPGRIKSASHVLLPGVGAAQNTMQRLQSTGLDRLIPTLQQPVLGVCLGMQLLFESSTEATAGAAPTACLNIIAGQVSKLEASPALPVPHMGWNQLQPSGNDPLLIDIAPKDYVYFVHSFAAPVTLDTIATSGYGKTFASVVRKGNFRGVQFHPERSAKVGARLLHNFLTLTS